MKYTFFILIFVSSIFSISLKESYFETAVKYYNNSSYDSAYIFFDKLKDMGIDDSRVYYNLGCTAFKQEKIGLSVLNFELAKLLDPHNVDIKANLRFVAQATIDKIKPIENNPFTNIVLKIHNMFNIQKQSLLLILLFSLISFFIILWRFSHPKFKKTFIQLSIFFSFLSIILLFSFIIKIKQEKTILKAVIMEPKVNIKSEPRGNNVLFSIHEGTTVTIIKEDNNWYNIHLPNGHGGWINANELALIQISK